MRTEPPKDKQHIRHHWLDSERASFMSIGEWHPDGYWYGVNEVGPISPEELARRGWRYHSAIVPPVPDGEAGG